jgi:hypothetical protein
MNSKGIICFTCIVSVALAVACFAGSIYENVGAPTPFTTYEAEAGTLAGNATVVALTSAPTNKFSSPRLEASGDAYVQFNQIGQSVTRTNNTNSSFTGINIRFCIPDAAGGGGSPPPWIYM